MLSYVLPISVAAVIMATLLSQLGKYLGFVNARRVRQAMSVLFLNSDSCQNAVLRAQLANSEFSMCQDAEQALEVHPMTGALFDLGDDFVSNMDGRARIFYRDLKSNMPYLVVLLLCLSLILCWAARAQRSYVNQLRAYNHYRLPASE